MKSVLSEKKIIIHPSGCGTRPIERQQKAINILAKEALPGNDKEA